MNLLIDKSALAMILNDADRDEIIASLLTAGADRPPRQVWAFSHDIVTLLSGGDEKTVLDDGSVIRELLAGLAVIPLRAVMMERAIGDNCVLNEHDLVRQAAASAKIEAIVTENPEMWVESGYPTHRLADLTAATFDVHLNNKNLSVPFIDLKAQLHQFYNEVDGRFHDIIHNTGFILGPYVQAFESAFADIHEIDHCIGVSTGTDALHIALWALGIGSGDRVIVPVNTFIATAEAVSMVGATPIFVDCDEYWNLSVGHCEEVLSDLQRSKQVLPKAIIPVHLYGQPADMSGIMALAEKFDLKIVEDCCQAHLARFQGRRVGGFGDFGAFSFYPGKNLGAFGEAGALISKEQDLFEPALLLRQHGETKKYHHQVVGHNYRMSALQGAVLGAKLPYLSGWTDRRRRHAQLYDQLLTGIEGVTTPKVRDGAEPVYHLYVIQAERRDALAAFLNKKGVATGLHYPVPLHLQPAYADLGYESGNFPVAEKAAAKLLSLPMYPELSGAQIQRVCSLVREFYDSGQ